LKDTEDWCFNAFKGFALLFYENLEDEQNLLFPVYNPLLLSSYMLKRFDPLAARQPY